jgi:putative FmdB family regulatory protein
MPTYDYECCECGHRFELFQSIKADPIETCPSCAGHVRRLIGTGAALLFKGNGFYITDYRSDSYKEGAKREAESQKQTKASSKKEK